jgi:hypothetical protein
MVLGAFKATMCDYCDEPYIVSEHWCSYGRDSYDTFAEQSELTDKTQCTEELMVAQLI